MEEFHYILTSTLLFSFLELTGQHAAIFSMYIFRKSQNHLRNVNM